MIISFEDQELHDRCSELERADAAFGSQHAQALVTFISDAEAFESADELIAFMAKDVEISDGDSLLVKIGTEYRAELVAVGTRFARFQDERVDWTTVTRLKVLQISRHN